MEVTAAVAPGSQQTSVTDRAMAQVADSFDRAQRVLEEVAVTTAATIARMAKRAAKPSKVEVQFGLNVSAKGDIIVAGASGSASLQVKVVYDPGR